MGFHQPDAYYRPQADSYRPGNSNGSSNGFIFPEERFSFRQAPPSPIREQFEYKDKHPSYNAHEYGRENTLQQTRKKSDSTNRPVNRRRRSPRPPHHGHIAGQGRGSKRSDRPARHGANDRAILGFTRGTTPEQLSGMNADQEPVAKFMSINDVSDSSEAEMEIASDGSEAGEFVETAPLAIQSSADITQPPPKWSNPEVFTALPPPDESRGKKRDVVKLIKKARLSTTQLGVKNDAAAANDDFISFDLSEKPARPVEASKPSKSPRLMLAQAQGTDHNINDSALPITRPPVVLPPKPQILKDARGRNEHRNINRDATNTQPTNRKRKMDEVGSLSPPPLPKKGRKAPSNGAVLPEWSLPTPEISTPWCTSDHSVTENMGFWLHKELCDYYEFVKPKEHEIVVRSDLVARLQQAIDSMPRFRGSLLQPFGSFAARLFLPDADMDLVLLSNSYMNGGPASFGNKNKEFFALGGELERQGIAARHSVEPIVHAKVKILKFVDRLTGIKVDLSMENTTGVTALNTFDRWKAQYPAMPILVTIIKQFLAMRGLNEVSNGGLGGFSVTCLVVSMLQLMPQVQSGNLKPEHHLGEILLEFLDLYGNRFNISQAGIRLDPPGYFDKREEGPQLARRDGGQRLTIQDPNNADNDISGGTSNIYLIQEQFAKAFEILQREMSFLHTASLETRQGRVLLGPMLSGNYSSFNWHRVRMQKIWKHA
ncbi:MAG: hypothetical protein M1814_003407 [Vezdaea aestivalis]|nr:MAG: hypothetical protein M1814_003407 [Vezdaea aestivalis]